VQPKQIDHVQDCDDVVISIATGETIENMHQRLSRYRIDTIYELLLNKRYPCAFCLYKTLEYLILIGQ